jgi:conjugative transfer signal peptidase TraF
MSRVRTVYRWSAIAAASVLALGGLCYGAGARINTTTSIAPGLYWITSAAVEKGGYVMFCPPQQSVFAIAKERGYIEPGFCDGGYGYLMKRVLAAKDDRVTFDADGVRVNGELVPFSKPATVDASGRPLMRYVPAVTVLRADQVLLMSDVSPISFDGRYFGPVERQQIKWAIRPIITW